MDFDSDFELKSNKHMDCDIKMVFDAELVSFLLQHPGEGRAGREKRKAEGLGSARADPAPKWALRGGLLVTPPSGKRRSRLFGSLSLPLARSRPLSFARSLTDSLSHSPAYSTQLNSTQLNSSRPVSSRLVSSRLVSSRLVS